MLTLIKNGKLIRFGIVEFLLISFFLFIVLFEIVDTPLIQTEYIPNVITGLVTISGILVASISFWINRSLKEEQYATKWMSARLKAIGVSIVIGLSLIHI